MRADRISILLIASILLTAASAWITHRAIINSHKSLGWLFHTYEVLGKSSDLVSVLKDAEIRKRSSYTEGDANSQETFVETSYHTRVILDTLKALVSDNASQTRLLTLQIEPVISDGLNSNSEEKAIGMSNRLDRLIKEFIHHEESLLSERLVKVDAAHRFQNIFRFTSLFLIGATSVLALITIWKKQNKNDTLIQQLNQSNRTLERKIKERTRELEVKNEITTELNTQLEQTLAEVQTFHDALQIRHDKAEDTFNEINDLYNNAPCGYHSLDDKGIIVRINNRELSWLGYKREEVIGRLSFRDIVIPDEIEKFNNNFNMFLKNKFIRDVEHNFLRKDGSTFQGLLNASAIFDKDGNYKMSSAVIVDITALKKMEQRMVEANRQLKKLNEDKDSLLGVVAHDLKSPLNGIIGLLNLLKSTLPAMEPEQQEYFRYIEHSCINMSALVNNLLDIGRIELGRNEINPERVELGVLLKQHIKIFEEQAERKKITIILEDNAPAVTLTTDPKVLTRIMENLISNAIKFSPHEKQIVIRVIHNAANIKVEVKDQGPGIAKEELPDLFKKYQRLSAKPTGGETSTGLGLSIVKELVSYLDGKISVESDRNAGATFILELPMVKDNEMENESSFHA